MFRGVSALSLDAKGRMAMPTKYRDLLHEYCQGHIVITIDPDYCLLLYPQPEWEMIEKELIRLPSLDKKARRLKRLLIGHATECTLDASGRLLLPPVLRAFAKLDKRVVLIGQGNKFELWDEQTWQARCEEWLAEESAEQSLSERLNELVF